MRKFALLKSKSGEPSILGRTGGLTLFGTVLITGCRFEIGQGLCRILKMTGAADIVIGSDFSTDHAGGLVFDHFVKTTRPDDPEYFDCIRGIIHKHKIDLIIPMSEAEIFLFSERGYGTSFEDVPVLTANRESILAGQDKLATADFLAKRGLLHPWTTAVESGDPREIPCVAKPRHGNESEDVIVVDDPGLIKTLRKTRPGHVWQELLLPETEEYTCGLFRSATGDVRSISFRRRLQGGYTCAGEVVCNDDIKLYLHHIAASLNLRGSVNVQLKLTAKGPVAFEINPRFSSTVVFRHLLGFEDLIWVMKDLKGIDPGPYQPVEAGARFYRGPREYIIPASPPGQGLDCQ